MAVCTFFGYGNTPSEAYDNVLEAIEEIITKCGVDKFYVGNHGNFDSIVRRALCAAGEKYPHIQHYVVLAYMPTENNEQYTNTIYPEGLERVPKKFAIAWRNKWMLSHADFVIGFVRYPIGGAYNFFELAKKMKKMVYNIADII